MDLSNFTTNSIVFFTFGTWCKTWFMTLKHKKTYLTILCVWGTGVTSSVYRVGYVLDGTAYKYWQEKDIFSLFLNVQTGSGAHTISCSMRTGVLSRGESGQDLKITSYLHLVPKLRMSGAIPLVPYTHLWRGKRKLHLLMLVSQPTGWWRTVEGLMNGEMQIRMKQSTCGSIQ